MFVMLVIVGWVKACVYLRHQCILIGGFGEFGEKYGPKIVGGPATLREGELGSRLTLCDQGRGLPARQVSS